jgi:hypothetical protein
MQLKPLITFARTKHLRSECESQFDPRRLLRLTGGYNPLGEQSIKHLIVLWTSVAFLSGCTAGPLATSYMGPTGESASTIRCTKDTAPCFEKASEVCNGGSYRVTNSYRNAGGLFADALPGPVTWYTMHIVCGPSDGKMPDFPLRGQEPTMPESPPVHKTTCSEIGNTVNCTTY